MFEGRRYRVLIGQNCITDDIQSSIPGITRGVGDMLPEVVHITSERGHLSEHPVWGGVFYCHKHRPSCHHLEGGTILTYEDPVFF